IGKGIGKLPFFGPKAVRDIRQIIGESLHGPTPARVGTKTALPGSDSLLPGGGKAALGGEKALLGGGKTFDREAMWDLWNDPLNRELLNGNWFGREIGRLTVPMAVHLQNGVAGRGARQSFRNAVGDQFARAFGERLGWRQARESGRGWADTFMAHTGRGSKVLGRELEDTLHWMPAGMGGVRGALSHDLARALPSPSWMKFVRAFPEAGFQAAAMNLSEGFFNLNETGKFTTSWMTTAGGAGAALGSGIGHIGAVKLGHWIKGRLGFDLPHHKPPLPDPDLTLVNKADGHQPADSTLPGDGAPFPGNVLPTTGASTPSSTSWSAGPGTQPPRSGQVRLDIPKHLNVGHTAPGAERAGDGRPSPFTPTPRLATESTTTRPVPGSPERARLEESLHRWQAPTELTRPDTDDTDRARLLLERPAAAFQAMQHLRQLADQAGLTTTEQRRLLAPADTAVARRDWPQAATHLTTFRNHIQTTIDPNTPAPHTSATGPDTRTTTPDPVTRTAAADQPIPTHSQAGQETAPATQDSPATDGGHGVPPRGVSTGADTASADTTPAVTDTTAAVLTDRETAGAEGEAAAVHPAGRPPLPTASEDTPAGLLPGGPAASQETLVHPESPAAPAAPHAASVETLVDPAAGSGLPQGTEWAKKDSAASGTKVFGTQTPVGADETAARQADVRAGTIASRAGDEEVRRQVTAGLAELASRAAPGGDFHERPADVVHAGGELLRGARRAEQGRLDRLWQEFRTARDAELHDQLTRRELLDEQDVLDGYGLREHARGAVDSLRGTRFEEFLGARTLLGGQHEDGRAQETAHEVAALRVEESFRRQLDDARTRLRIRLAQRLGTDPREVVVTEREWRAVTEELRMHLGRHAVQLAETVRWTGTFHAYFRQTVDGLGARPGPDGTAGTHDGADPDAGRLFVGSDDFWQALGAAEEHTVPRTMNELRDRLTLRQVRALQAHFARKMDSITDRAVDKAAGWGPDETDGLHVNDTGRGVESAEPDWHALENTYQRLIADVRPAVERLNVRAQWARRGLDGFEHALDEQSRNGAPRVPDSAQRLLRDQLDRDLHTLLDREGAATGTSVSARGDRFAQLTASYTRPEALAERLEYTAYRQARLDEQNAVLTEVLAQHFDGLRSGPAPSDAMVQRLRAQWERAVDQAVADHWFGHLGHRDFRAAALHPSGAPASGGAGHQRAPENRSWHESAAYLNATLVSRIQHGHELSAAAADAARDFHALLAVHHHNNPGRTLDDATRQALADEYRDKSLTAYDTIWAQTEHDTTAWLIHEKNHDDSFTTTITTLDTTQQHTAHPGAEATVSVPPAAGEAARPPFDGLVTESPGHPDPGTVEHDGTPPTANTPSPAPRPAAGQDTAGTVPADGAAAHGPEAEQGGLQLQEQARHSTDTREAGQRTVPPTPVPPRSADSYTPPTVRRGPLTPGTLFDARRLHTETGHERTELEIRIALTGAAAKTHAATVLDQARAGVARSLNHRPDQRYVALRLVGPLERPHLTLDLIGANRPLDGSDQLRPQAPRPSAWPVDAGPAAYADLLGRHTRLHTAGFDQEVLAPLLNQPFTVHTDVNDGRTTHVHVHLKVARPEYVAQLGDWAAERWSAAQWSRLDDIERDVSLSFSEYLNRVGVVDGTAPVSVTTELVDAGHLRPGEPAFHLADIARGTLTPDSGPLHGLLTTLAGIDATHDFAGSATAFRGEGSVVVQAPSEVQVFMAHAEETMEAGIEGLLNSADTTKKLGPEHIEALRTALASRGRGGEGTPSAAEASPVQFGSVFGAEWQAASTPAAPRPRPVRRTPAPFTWDSVSPLEPLPRTESPESELTPRALSIPRKESPERELTPRPLSIPRTASPDSFLTPRPAYGPTRRNAVRSLDTGSGFGTDWGGWKPPTDDTSKAMGGISAKNMSRFRRLSSELGLAIAIREVNEFASIRIEEGALPKPLDIKSKSLTPYDLFLEGKKPGTDGETFGFEKRHLGLTVFYDPADLKDQSQHSPSLRAAIEKHHAKRRKEFEDLREYMAKIETKFPVIDGIVHGHDRNGEFRPIASDIDLLDIYKPTGSPITPRTYGRSLDSIMQNIPEVLHGAHRHWDTKDPLEMEIRDKIDSPINKGRERVIVVFPHQEPVYKKNFSRKNSVDWFSSDAAGERLAAQGPRHNAVAPTRYQVLDRTGLETVASNAIRTVHERGTPTALDGGPGMYRSSDSPYDMSVQECLTLLHELRDQLFPRGIRPAGTVDDSVLGVRPQESPLALGPGWQAVDSWQSVADRVGSAPGTTAFVLNRHMVDIGHAFAAYALAPEHQESAPEVVWIDLTTEQPITETLPDWMPVEARALFVSPSGQVMPARRGSGSASLAEALTDPAPSHQYGAKKNKSKNTTAPAPKPESQSTESSSEPDRPAGIQVSEEDLATIRGEWRRFPRLTDAQRLGAERVTLRILQKQARPDDFPLINLPRTIAAIIDHEQDNRGTGFNSQVFLESPAIMYALATRGKNVWPFLRTAPELIPILEKSPNVLEALLLLPQKWFDDQENNFQDLIRVLMREDVMARLESDASLRKFAFGILYYPPRVLARTNGDFGVLSALLEVVNHTSVVAQLVNDSQAFTHELLGLDDPVEHIWQLHEVSAVPSALHSVVARFPSKATPELFRVILSGFNGQHVNRELVHYPRQLILAFSDVEILKTVLKDPSPLATLKKLDTNSYLTDVLEDLPELALRLLSDQSRITEAVRNPAVAVALSHDPHRYDNVADEDLAAHLTATVSPPLEPAKDALAKVLRENNERLRSPILRPLLQAAQQLKPDPTDAHPLWPHHLRRILDRRLGQILLPKEPSQVAFILKNAARNEMAAYAFRNKDHLLFQNHLALLERTSARTEAYNSPAITYWLSLTSNYAEWTNLIDQNPWWASASRHALHLQSPLPDHIAGLLSLGNSALIRLLYRRPGLWLDAMERFNDYARNITSQPELLNQLGNLFGKIPESHWNKLLTSERLYALMVERTESSLVKAFKIFPEALREAISRPDFTAAWDQGTTDAESLAHATLEDPSRLADLLSSIEKSGPAELTAEGFQITEERIDSVRLLTVGLSSRTPAEDLAPQLTPISTADITEIQKNYSAVLADENMRGAAIADPAMAEALLFNSEIRELISVRPSLLDKIQKQSGVLHRLLKVPGLPSLLTHHDSPFKLFTEDSTAWLPFDEIRVKFLTKNPEFALIERGHLTLYEHALLREFVKASPAATRALIKWPNKVFPLSDTPEAITALQQAGEPVVEALMATEGRLEAVTEMSYLVGSLGESPEVATALTSRLEVAADQAEFISLVGNRALMTRLASHPELIDRVLDEDVLSAAQTAPALVDVLARTPEESREALLASRVLTLVRQDPVLAEELSRQDDLRGALIEQPRLVRLLQQNGNMLNALRTRPELVQAFRANRALVEVAEEEPALWALVQQHPALGALLTRQLRRELLHHPVLTERVLGMEQMSEEEARALAPLLRLPALTHLLGEGDERTGRFAVRFLREPAWQARARTDQDFASDLRKLLRSGDEFDQILADADPGRLITTLDRLTGGLSVGARPGPGADRPAPTAEEPQPAPAERNSGAPAPPPP
ncbi:hypothetical protein, partial [Streptomyces sp. NPDC056160]|uniref:hypothetical protein n=1 Tax=Streptomyces sp. NPDC056160 TaxID=3345731 RepID=UPI0035DD7C11